MFPRNINSKASGATAALACLLLGAFLLLLLFSGRAGDLVASGSFSASSRFVQPWCPMEVPATGDTANATRAWTFPIPPFPASFWFVQTMGTEASTLATVFNTICNAYGILWWQADVTRLEIGTQQPRTSAMQLVQKKMKNFTDTDYKAITTPMVYNADIAQLLLPKYLFTIVRHPLERLRAHYEQVACEAAAVQQGWNASLPHRQKQEVGPSRCYSDPEFKKLALQNDTVQQRWAFAKSQDAQDHMFGQIRGTKFSVQDAAAQYEFIFTTERLHEGLAVFMLKYGLTFEDIAYLPVQDQTGIVSPFAKMPQDFIDYVSSTNKNDMLLWEIANIRLDQEIAALQQRCAPGQVELAVQALTVLLAEIQEDCAKYQEWQQSYVTHAAADAITYTGLPGVAFDTGHGYRCVRHVARRFQFTGPTAGQSGGLRGILLGSGSKQNPLCKGHGQPAKH